MNLRAACSMTLLAACAWAANIDKSKVTYSKDVAPILNQRCVECHRAGEVAPMAFTSYQAARPWAKSIRERPLRESGYSWA